MNLEKIKVELAEAKAKGNLAFVLGNGINRYRSQSLSWKEMIASMSDNADTQAKIRSEELNGISLTELYDILYLNDSEFVDSKVRSAILNRYFKQGQGFLVRSSYVHWLQQKLGLHNVPVLTTNYDDNIEEGLSQHTIKNYKLYKKGYSDTYPLGEYYAPKEITDSDYTRHFAVWHIHGRFNLKRSLRLGYSDYMNLLVHTKKHLHKQACLFNVKKPDDEWGIRDYKTKEKEPTYYFTWLNIFYNCSLCINGLGLEPDETYLRWLLISRKKYLNRIGLSGAVKGWYICRKDDMTPGKRFFLKNVGFDVVELNDYKECYKDAFDF